MMTPANGPLGTGLRAVVRAIVLLCASGLLGAPGGHGANAAEGPARRNDLLERGTFIQIPGPNPILRPGAQGAWDDGVVEAADALKDFGTYYLYYHATGSGKGYRLGVATASHPLGPFRKHGDRPIVDLGPPGSWEDMCVACAMVLKEKTDTYTMWYSGRGTSERHQKKWGIGLATADNPLGPWKKHPGNPIIDDFGYVGGVVKVGGKYHLYTAHPIDSTGRDYSPMALATADKPEGPWTPWPNNPVLKQGEWGEWDDGGFSEAEVLYHSGVFHMFYGGAKLYVPRIVTRECIGYAYSFDGRSFVKYGWNPVATREANPNASAFAEVHAIFEPPFIYLYHTHRYKVPPVDEKEKFPKVEHLGVQVLATQRPFRLDMPVLGCDSLPPRSATVLADSPPLCLSNVRQLALTAECAYSRKATRPLRIHVRSSHDGTNYDTADLFQFDNDLRPGELCRKTFALDAKVRFVKLVVENADPSEAVTDVRVSATLGG